MSVVGKKIYLKHQIYMDGTRVKVIYVLFIFVSYLYPSKNK